MAVGVHTVDQLRARVAPFAAGIGILALSAAVGLYSGWSEEGVRGFIIGPAIFALVSVLLFRHVRRHPEGVRLLRMVWAGHLLRLWFAVVHLIVGFVVYRGAIDFVGYHDLAGIFIDQLLAQAGMLPQTTHYDFGPTSMNNYVTMLFLALLRVVVGPEFLGMFMVTAAAGTVAAWLFYRAFEIAHPGAAGRRFFAIVIFLLPSVGFWSIFLGKDVIVFFFLSVATYAMARLLSRFALPDVALLGVALVFLMLVRAPVGVAVVLASVLAMILRPLRWHGADAWLKPVQRTLVAIGLVVGFYYFAADALLRFGVREVSIEAIAERAAQQHQGFASTEGGSQLESALQATDPVSVALYLPVGVSTLLFRPFLWEAHNALALAAGIENLFFMGLVVWRLPALMRSVRAMVTSPFTLFVAITFLLTATAVSFQWNLGAAARLRTMALPFLLLLMADPTPEPKRPDATAD